ncbi:MAG: lytic murein transglycosylase [Alphaproteobacteria bacterium]|nr:lytic murein transglycosylase [Alphaproteobacteria bacterium]
MLKIFMWLIAATICVPCYATVDRGAFDLARWNSVVDDLRVRATNEKISTRVFDDTFRSPAVIPSILKSDASQSEFTLTMSEYLSRTVNPARVKNGRIMRKKYPTLLSRVNNKYGVPPHVIMAFWGLESNYGATKARHQLTDAFFTLIYDGRRQEFFSNQLIALMKIADKNKLNINDIGGSWAGAMGHFQFIPTTLAQYGADGNGDGRIDIINSVGDAMFSAGNYLNKLGWNKKERIVRRVVLPGDFDVGMLDGKTKLTLPQWAALGVTNPDGTRLPQTEMLAGLVADVKSIEIQRAEIANQSASIASDDVKSVAPADTDIAPLPVINAYLTYPNFYRIKKWNNSNWYAIAVAELADQLK